MQLSEWCAIKGRGEMSRLARETRLAYSTVFEAAKNGKPIVEYATAKKISDATGGEVSIAELCEPTPANGAPAPAPADAPLRAEGPGGATTARERALLAVNNQCLLGYEPPSAEEVLDAIEAAGLRVVDAAACDEARATLVAIRDDFLPTDDEQIGYGAFHGGDPRNFTPDPECSTDEERAAHKAACDAWARGEEIAVRGGCEYREVEPGTEIATAVEEIRKEAGAAATVAPGIVRVQAQTFGLGTYVCRDPQVTEIVERINAAIGALGGQWPHARRPFRAPDRLAPRPRRGARASAVRAARRGRARVLVVIAPEPMPSARRRVLAALAAGHQTASAIGREVGARAESVKRDLAMLVGGGHAENSGEKSSGGETVYRLTERGAALVGGR